MSKHAESVNKLTTVRFYRVDMYFAVIPTNEQNNVIFTKLSQTNRLLEISTKSEICFLNELSIFFD